MPLIPIETLDDPRVAPYRNVRDAHLQRGAAFLRGTAFQGGTSPGGIAGARQVCEETRTALKGGPTPLFMAEGEVVVRRLVSLAAGPSPTHALHSVLLTPTRLETLRDALDRLSPETPVYLASQRLMDAITGFHIHRGVLAAGIRPPEPALDDILRNRPPSTRQTLLVLEDLANHDNIGGIFRNAAAFGAAAVLLSPRCADPLYRKAIRVSAGQALSVPFTRLSPWPEALSGLRERGHHLAALVTDPDAPPLADWISAAPEKTTLIVGAEGPGLTSAARAYADDLVRIPMAPGVDSLNVGAAAAIALHALAARPAAAS